MKKLNLMLDRKFGANISMTMVFVNRTAGKWSMMLLLLFILALIQISNPLYRNAISIVISFISSLYSACYLKLYVESQDGMVGAGAILKTTIINSPGFLITTMLYSAAVSLSSAILVPPDIYVAVSCGFFGFCFLNYDHSPITAISKSFELVKGNWFITFGFIVVILLILLVMNKIIAQTIDNHMPDWMD